jgi:glycosyltransferase involved in cell wall biosynthesis
MQRGHVVMGLVFYPRGGSAYVTRSLTRSLTSAGWSVGLAVGSLGDPGDETHAATFFDALDVHALDYTAAAQAFADGGDAFAASVPMQPSYEDRDGVADAVLASVDPVLADHFAAVWDEPLRDAGADRAEVFHLHHLTPQLDAAHRHWPETPLVVHLHGTEVKLFEAIAERAALAAALGETLATMPVAAEAGVGGDARDLDERQDELLRTTRWDRWRHGAFWADRLREQARTADHLITVSPKDRDSAIALLGVDPDDVTAIPNGVDLELFHPVPRSRGDRRSAFRHWLLDDARGWTEGRPPGTLVYREQDLDRLLGVDADATVLLYVGRFTAAKRLPTLIRAFARARDRFERQGSLVIWGGHPGEWEGEHPATVAAEVGTDGIFFTGWRGHDDLPAGLAECDGLVMASVNDSYPQTPLEAMAVGLPVIACRSGGLPSMVNVDESRPTGWLVPPDDVDSLADAIVAAVNDPAERVQRGANALDHARAELSWEGLVTRFEAAYVAAIEHHARRLEG